MKCENCKYFDNNYTIQIIGKNIKAYWTQGVYCKQRNKAALTKEDLKKECKIEDD
jgi:hypothetical protein